MAQSNQEKKYIERVYKEVGELEALVSRPPEKDVKVQNTSALTDMNKHMSEAKKKISDLRAGRTFIGMHLDSNDNKSSAWDILAEAIKKAKNSFSRTDTADELLITLQLLDKVHDKWQKAYNYKKFLNISPIDSNNK